MSYGHHRSHDRAIVVGRAVLIADLPPQPVGIPDRREIDPLVTLIAELELP
jgi:hypothetical protein